MERDRLRTYGDALAVVTVTRTRADVLDRFVGSLGAATERPVQVVVADVAGITPPPGADVVRLREDVGPCAAANRAIAGLDVAFGWVVIAAPQVRWCAGALDTLLAAAGRHPRAGALGPLVRGPSGAVVATACALPGTADLLCGRPPRAANGGAVGWLSATCLLLRRAAWDSVDGFDPRYVGSWGEVDLGDRLGRAGWLAVHVPDAEVATGPAAGESVLEPPGAGRRRYVQDRRSAALRAAVTVTGRLRATGPGTTPNWRRSRAG